MSYRVASTSGKIELKTRYFLQNIAFFAESRKSITNTPPVLNYVLSKLLVVKNLGYLVKISLGHFYIFFLRFGSKFTKAWPVWKAADGEKLAWLNSACSEKLCTAKFKDWVELICRVLICNLLGFVQISVGQNDFESSSCFHSSLRLLRDGSAVEDNLQGENGEEFSQNGPSYTYEMRWEVVMNILIGA